MRKNGTPESRFWRSGIVTAEMSGGVLCVLAGDEIPSDVGHKSVKATCPLRLAIIGFLLGVKSKGS